MDRLIALQFIRGEYDADDYWSFVQHCRRSIPGDPASGVPEVVNDHRRPVSGWYEMVAGPVAAFWKQRAVVASSDQFSFHEGGIDSLNALIAAGRGQGADGAGDPNTYQWFDVT